MAKKDRHGFTLVELLVVIVIMTMLVGLLLPAINSARKRARQLECTNNQKQLGLAIQQYDATRGNLPGYLNTRGVNTTIGPSDPLARSQGGSAWGGPSRYFHPLSWAVVIIPHTGEKSLWEQWRDQNETMATKYANARVDLPLFKCPADPAVGKCGLSYVVNCGEPDSPRLTRPGFYERNGTASALFFNHTQIGEPRTSIDKIPDGATNTLLLSENIQATEWAPLAGNQPDIAIEPDVGMVWFSTTTVPSPSCVTINACMDAELARTDAAFKNREYARPSSFHSGGVVATFADGRVDFLSEQTDYTVFRSQMAPKDQHFSF